MGDRIRVTEDGGATDGVSEFGPTAVRQWLNIEQMRAWAAGDAPRAHFCTAAMNREDGELEAILNGRPSPGVADGSARRDLDGV